MIFLSRGVVASLQVLWSRLKRWLGWIKALSQGRGDFRYLQRVFLADDDDDDDDDDDGGSFLFIRQIRHRKHF